MFQPLFLLRRHFYLDHKKLWPKKIESEREKSFLNKANIKKFEIFPPEIIRNIKNIATVFELYDFMKKKHWVFIRLGVTMEAVAFKIGKAIKIILISFSFFWLI